MQSNICAAVVDERGSTRVESLCYGACCVQ